MTKGAEKNFAVLFFINHKVAKYNTKHYIYIG